MEKMKIMRLNYFDAIYGDGRPSWTEFYRDVPDEFKLTESWDIIDGMYEHLEANKEELITGFELAYAGYEINGVTYQDFKDLVQERLYSRGEMLDRIIGLMDGKLYEPYAEKTEESATNTTAVDTGTGLSSEVDVPKDNPGDDKDTSRSKSEISNNSDIDTTFSKTESAFGFDRPFELVNKFLKEGKTKIEVFNEAMEDCFINMEVAFIW